MVCSRGNEKFALQLSLYIIEFKAKLAHGMQYLHFTNSALPFIRTEQAGKSMFLELYSSKWLFRPPGTDYAYNIDE